MNSSYSFLPPLTEQNDTDTLHRLTLYNGERDMPSRRDFLAGAASAFVLAPGAGAAQPANAPPAPNGQKLIHTLPPLLYAPDALEPVIDTKTMELHHGKHHGTYVEKLNSALAKQNDLGGLSVDKLLLSLDKVSEEVRADIRNNGGGHANHSMFWSIMAPDAGGEPKGEILRTIMDTFGAVQTFREKFNTAGSKHFGAGWVFLTIDPTSGALAIETRSNQDTPIMDGKRVIMGNDLWEHAFYLKYSNNKDQYLRSWWNVVNWAEIERRYKAIRAGETII
jgi:Fe-Mn family superoxide dismutase